MYFNMVKTDLLEMCSLGPSNPPPLPLPPTTLSPYLVYYFDFNGTEKSQTKWKIRFAKDISDCSKNLFPSKLYGQHLMEIKLHSITYLLRGSNTEFSCSERTL